MPTHRPLNDAEPLPADAPASRWTSPTAQSLAIPGLLIAVALGVAAAFVPDGRGVLVAIAVLIALPAGFTALWERHMASLPPLPVEESEQAPPLTDPQRGRANRDAWHAALDHAIESGRVSPLSIVRLMIDGNPASFLDDAEADQVLAMTAIQWQEALRPGDLLSRFEHDSFAILLPRCDRSSAEAVVARLRNAMPGAGACTVGVATWDGSETAEHLIARADESLAAARARIHANPLIDPERLAAVSATGLATHETHEEFNEIARGISWLLDLPVVTITLFDAGWQHYIGEEGLTALGLPTEGSSADDAICTRTVTTGQPLIVSNTERHPTLGRSAAVQRFGIAACASLPVVSKEGHVLGTVCAMSTDHHQWSADDVSLLRLTARRVALRVEHQHVPG